VTSLQYSNVDSVRRILRGLAYLTASILLLSGIRFLVIPGYHAAGSPYGTRLFAGFAYLFGMRVADAVFYRNLWLVCSAVGLLYGLWTRRRWVLFLLGLLTVSHGTGGVRFALGEDIFVGEPVAVAVGGLFVVVAALSQSSSRSRQFTHSAEPRDRRACPYWRVLGLLAGYLTAGVCLAVAVTSFTPLAYPFGGGWQTTGLDHTLSRGNEAAPFDAALATTALAAIIWSLLRTRAIRWLRVFAIVGVPALVPVILYGGPRNTAVAAGVILLIVAALGVRA
jgi:hypothetical protein